MYVVSCQTHSLRSSQEGHSRLEFVTRQGWWLLITTKGTTQPQLTPGRWELLISRQSVLPDQAQADSPQVPDSEPQGIVGSRASGSDKWSRVLCYCQYLQGGNRFDAPTQYFSAHPSQAPQQTPKWSWAGPGESNLKGSSSALHEPPQELWSLALLSSLGSNNIVPTGKERAQLLLARLVSADLNT